MKKEEKVVASIAVIYMLIVFIAPIFIETCGDDERDVCAPFVNH